MSPLKTYWPQITATLIFAFALGGSYYQQNANAEDIQANSEAIKEEKKEVKENGKKLVRIETNQENMKDDLDEIKRLLRERG